MNKNFDKDKILSESLNLNRDYIDNLASRTLTQEKFMSNMKQKYQYLHDNFNSIFSMCITKNYDHTRLSFMVEMAQKVQNNEMKEHDASVKVGQILVDDIVKPQLDKK